MTRSEPLARSPSGRNLGYFTCRSLTRLSRCSSESVGAFAICLAIHSAATCGSRLIARRRSALAAVAAAVRAARCSAVAVAQ